MATGRKQTKAPEIVAPDLDQDRINNAMEIMRQESADVSLVQAQHQAMVRAVATKMGYQLPADCTDPDLIQRDISANMRRSVEACLEVGRGLAVLKVACEHGNFMARLEVLGIEDRVARRFMQTAMKFSNRASTPVLKAAGNQTKLFEMLVLDDEEIEELALTGQTGELKLDDIATMSVKELRVALREARGEAEAQAELIRKKNEKIEDLEVKQARIPKVRPDDALQELHKETTAIFNDARGALVGQLRQAFVCIQTHHESNGGNSAAFQAGLVAQLQADLAILRDEFNLPDVPAGQIPEWVSQIEKVEG